MLKLNLVLTLALTSVLAVPLAKIPRTVWEDAIAYNKAHAGVVGNDFNLLLKAIAPIPAALEALITGPSLVENRKREASDASAQAAFGGKETRDARAGVGLFNGVNTLVSTVVAGVEVLAFDLFRGGHVKREVSDAPAHAASGRKEMRDARPVEWVIDEVEKVVDTVAVDVDLLLEGLKKIHFKREASDASAQAAFGRKETRDARAQSGMFGGSIGALPLFASGLDVLGFSVSIGTPTKKEVDWVTKRTSAAINAVKRVVGAVAKDARARALDLVGRSLAHPGLALGSVQVSAGVGLPGSTITLDAGVGLTGSTITLGVPGEVEKAGEREASDASAQPACGGKEARNENPTSKYVYVIPSIAPTIAADVLVKLKGNEQCEELDLLGGLFATL